MREVSGTVRGYQCEQLMDDLKIDLEFASNVHFGVRSNTGAVRRLQYPYYRGANQADVYYCINLRVGMGINMGMHNNGVKGLIRHSIFNPYELRRCNYKASFF